MMQQGLAGRRAGRDQLGQRAALYCRVSTADQSCERQERDLTAFTQRAGYEVVGIYKETGSGARMDRVERRKVIALAQRREIDVVLVTELSRWGRSTVDLLHTLEDLQAWRVSVIALNGLAFDLSTAAGRMSGSGRSLRAGLDVPRGDLRQLVGGDAPPAADARADDPLVAPQPDRVL